VPRVLSDWLTDLGSNSDQEVLDFGCGDGVTALGMALQYMPKRVAGIVPFGASRSAFAVRNTESTDGSKFASRGVHVRV
jgi:cyclopropane fatty-acyl-phospholipid synthase-like methyltransferase